MLTSLFGDLGRARESDDRTLADGSSAVDFTADPRAASTAGGLAFAATALTESVETDLNARGQIVDRHSRDLVVTGSPAQAIREHYAATRSDLDRATSIITIVDPTGLWASAVVKALSDAGGQPIERLHLRDQATLRTLAMIERTTLVRRQQATLRVYHADVRAPGSDNAAIPLALMERSQLATVIIGTLQPYGVETLLRSLLAAARLPDWHCPHLLFVLPPSAAWIASQIRATPWPGRLQAHVISESMSGASSVWNAMLGLWNQVGAEAKNEATAAEASGFMAGIADRAEAVGAAADAERSSRADAVVAAGFSAAMPTDAIGTLDLVRARQAMRGMLPLDGMLACAIVDSGSGMVLAHELRDGARVDVELAGAACAEVLLAHRGAARRLGLAGPVEEVMTTAGPRHQVMRVLTRHPELFLIALLDRQRTNLALARFHLMELERGLQ